MTRTLRSNFTPGSTPWAMRRAQWSALGLTDADLEKPKIAIVNSSSQLASCFSHLDEVVGPLKEAITEAGGVAFEVRTAAPSDAITSAGAAGQYILPSRDLIASDIEVAVEGALLDGMVCLASCDKTTPGQLMAAGRLNIPTIIVACGYQPSGTYKGESVDFEDIFRFAGHVNAGRMTVDELAEMSRCAVTGPGVCAGMGTANSMHLAAEALGMALPGTTPVLARGEKMWDAIARAGSRIVALVEEDQKPRSVLTHAAFSNAVTAILAVSGSVNCLKHLQAIAVEAGCDADVYQLFEDLAPKVPLLTDVKPNGDTQITQFDAAGGTLGLLKQLAPLLDLSAVTVGGITLGEAIESATVDEAVIRPLDRPLATHPGIVVMRGSLAPHGAVLKRTVADGAPLEFRGPAKVVHSRDEGVAAAKAGRFKDGDVVVLTGLGLRGSPGMGLTSALMFAIDGAGLSTKVAVITDGQMSGLVNGGLVVAEVSPEGAAGGPLGLVRDGDMITIDVHKRSIDLEVDPGELDRRRADLPPLTAPAGCGWLSVYARTVAPLGAGATLGGVDDGGDLGDVGDRCDLVDVGAGMTSVTSAQPPAQRRRRQPGGPGGSSPRESPPQAAGGLRGVVPPGKTQRKAREPVRAVRYIDREVGTAVADVPDPSPAPDEVVVKVDACGLCGSDVHAVHSGQCAPGQILGHEFSGQIVALGAEVTGWSEGQAVAASPLGSCGKCRICMRGMPFRCPAAPNIGVTCQGAYAQYAAVPARQLVALPPELPVEIGSHAEPLSVASQAVKLAAVGPGDPVLVYGVGPIGLYAIMALRLAGAGPIVAAGRSAGRRAAAADVGADVVIDTRETSVASAAQQSGTRFAAALECSAAPGAFSEALSVLEPGGTCVEVALTPEVASLPLFGMLSEGLHLAGACAFSDETYRESVAHLAAGRVPVERLVSERVSLDDTPDALRRLQTPGSLVRILSRPWQLTPGGATPRTPRLQARSCGSYRACQ